MNLIFPKPYKKKFSIKVFFTLTVIICLISTSFTIINIHHQSKTLTNHLIQNGKLLTEILAYNSRIGVFSENEELLRDIVDGIFHQKGVLEVSVFNPEGKLLKKVESPKLRALEKSIKEDQGSVKKIFERLMTSRTPFYLENIHKFKFWSPVISASGYLKEDSLFFEEDILRQKNRIIGFVGITIDKEILNQKLTILLFKCVSIGIIFLIIGSLVVYFVAKEITRPLKRLTESVNTLGMGGDVQKVPVETDDEIGELAKAFNNMSSSLKKREAEKFQLENQLRQSQKIEAIGTLAGGIAHDFNNILGIIMGYTELASLEVPEGVSLKDKLKEILKAGNRARDLVYQLLTFSRQKEKELKPVDVSLVAKEVLKMLRAWLPTTIEIRQHIKTGSATVLSDPTHIHQVLMNLCTNAAHAMREKRGILEVSLVDVDIDADVAAQHLDMIPGRYQRLIVKDTGHGMDREVMERIFDPFFTTKGLGEGTGMGLSMVHGIVKSYNGTILVDSKLGKGTTFQVFFPTIENNNKVKSEFVPPLSKGSERILFIDDEAAMASLGRQMLQQLGYDVVAKTSSIEALEVFRSQPDKFDLVITDMTMPNMTGTDLAQEIVRFRSDIPIILCTGFSEVLSEEKAKAIGIRHFVMKPYNRQKLAALIRQALDSK